MQIIAWLSGVAPDIDTPAPPAPVAVSPPPTVPATPDIDEPELLTAEDVADGIDLEPVYTIIDYTDAAGQRSRRRITMLKLVSGRNGALLSAICHERKAMRRFRCDRIDGFIEADGEVIDAVRFMREIMFIDLTTFGPQAEDAALAQARAALDFLRPVLSVLTIAARCDNDFHPSELDAILQYAEREVVILGREGRLEQQFDIAALDHLADLIRRMRPQRGSLEGYLRTISTYDTDRQIRLYRALETVVNADHVVTDAEFGLIGDFNAIQEQLDREFERMNRG